MSDQKPNAPAQGAKEGSDKDAKAAYEAKQAKDVKESVEKCRSDSEFCKTVQQVKEDRQEATTPKATPAPKPEVQEEDNGYYNGVSP